jgi:hypothetical protein
MCCRAVDKSKALAACPGPINFKGMRASPKRHGREINIVDIEHSRKEYAMV